VDADDGAHDGQPEPVPAGRGRAADPLGAQPLKRLEQTVYLAGRDQWPGFAVLCGYTALALSLAAVAVRSRDA
jgi:hypothetical protein